MADNEATKKNIEMPEKLLELLEAEDTALEIARICFENEIKDDPKIRGISYRIGRVLLGDLPPKEFQKTLEEEMGISPFSASKISGEINESIFSPVKEDLAVLYGSEVIISETAPGISPKITEEESEKRERGSEDTYREPIE